MGRLMWCEIRGSRRARRRCLIPFLECLARPPVLRHQRARPPLVWGVRVLQEVNTVLLEMVLGVRGVAALRMAVREADRRVVLDPAVEEPGEERVEETWAAVAVLQPTGPQCCEQPTLRRRP